MTEEIEAKVRVASPEAVRRRVAALGAEARGPVLEVNRLFDDAEGSLRAGGAALRLREERRPRDGAVVRTTLTWKGPQRPGELKRRVETETTVGEAGPVGAILAALGFRETFRYEKRRTAWDVGVCEVVLDEVPHLGWFVEVEGPDEASVRRTVADLGLADEPTIAESYVHLLAAYLEAAHLDAGRATFGGGA